MFEFVEGMTIDEAGIYSLTKYTSKTGSQISVKESDHRTIFLEVNWDWNPRKPETEKRVEVYNLNDPDCFKEFVRATNDNTKLRSCFNNEVIDIEEASKQWLKVLNDIIKSTFNKIRIKKNKN